MPAFKDTAVRHISEAILSLYVRMQHTNALELSHQDLLDLFVPKCDHDVLLRIRHISSETFLDRNLQVNWCVPERPKGLTFLMHNTADKKHPAAPKKLNWFGSEHKAIVTRIDSWLERRLALGVDYSRIQQVFGILNERCSSPQQVKFLWPSIVSLCKMNDATREIAYGMEAARTPASIPTLSPELRSACRKTAGAIAVANLLGELPDVTPEVTITCDGVSVTEEGLGTWESF
jgi:hypothetical protein